MAAAMAEAVFVICPAAAPVLVVVLEVTGDLGPWFSLPLCVKGALERVACSTQQRISAQARWTQ